MIVSTAQAYPLEWPEGFPRWKSSRTSGAFRTSFEGALSNVRKSLEAFARDSGKAITQPVLSSNIDLNPLSSNTGKRPHDPGVAVWFVWDGLSVCIPVDRYDTPAANLQAIHHIIEARRTELRHGTLALVRATFQGFKALPPPEGTRPWKAVLGFPLDADVGVRDVEQRYRDLAKDRHPDAPGGSTAAMTELNVARQRAFKELAT